MWPLEGKNEGIGRRESKKEARGKIMLGPQATIQSQKSMYLWGHMGRVPSNMT